MQNPSLSVINTNLKKSLIFALACSFFTSMLLLAVPLYSLQVFDRVMNSRSEDTLLMLCIIALWLTLMYSILDWVKNRVLLQTSLEWSSTIKQLLTVKILESADLEGKNLKSQALNSIDKFSNFVAQGLSPLFELPWSPLLIVILALIHPLFGVISLIAAICLLIVAFVNFTNKPKQLNQQHLKLTAITEYSQEIKTLGMLDIITKALLESERQENQELNKHASKEYNLLAIARFIRLAAQIIIIAVGAYLVLNGETSVGALIASSMIFGRAIGPFEQAVTQAKNWLSCYRLWLDMSKLNKTFEKVVEPDCDLVQPSGKLTLAGVMLTYPNSNIPFLHGINLNFSPGDSAAIVGAQGAGKSTLLALIAGHYQPNLGKIRLDSAAFEQWSSEVLGAHLGFYSSKSALLKTSVFNNISRFKADEAASFKACERVGMHQTILSWPKGYDSIIGVDIHPSDGEVQKLLLARAIFDEPAVLILDEPDSFQDSAGERLISEMIKERCRKNKTTLFTTNRSGLLGAANRVVVLNKGSIERDQSAAQICNSTNSKKIKNENRA
ncbi:ATP-binding cassette domain-containing protein [Vibrio europaeus]|uniref:ATP-binding cassette domain-containing protein n=1 Tax=Vibrio europaeus TaxID=300876 RepID=UPI00148BAB83|nr:ATP-binding cassette domain-containing protein [Vibrio europaeus]NOH24998.1 ATP-binding cassette domain-containing protein [Vibrio europaeus]